MSWKRLSPRNTKYCEGSTPPEIGPGAYSVDSCLSSSRLATEIRKNANRTQFIQHTDKTPSPCDYDPQIPSSGLKASSSFRSKSRREVFSASDSPSPAEYQSNQNWKPQKSQIRPPDYKLPKGYSPNVGQDVASYDVCTDGSILPVKIQKRGPECVGPASYIPEIPMSSRVHRMKESYRELGMSPDDTPGPGAYAVESQQGRLCSHIFDRREAAPPRPPMSGDLPSEEFLKTDNLPSAVFKSKSARNVYPNVDEGPNPAKYSKVQERKFERSASAFGSKAVRFTEMHEDNPGPGLYDINQEWVKKQKTIGRKAKRKGKVVSDTPSPVSYNVEEGWVSGYGRPSPSLISSSQRGKVENIDIPGPGTYESVEQKGRASTIHSSRFEKHGNFMYVPTVDNPPPDRYQNIDGEAVRGRSISRTSRFERQKGNEIPGPGAYDIHQSLIKHSYNADCVNIEKIADSV